MKRNEIQPNIFSHLSFLSAPRYHVPRLLPILLSTILSRLIRSSVSVPPQHIPPFIPSFISCVQRKSNRAKEKKARRLEERAAMDAVCAKVDAANKVILAADYSVL